MTAADSTVAVGARIADTLPLRILGADDVAANGLVLDAVCRQLGYAIDLVGDGEQVLAQVAARPYDLLLLDVRMPRLDGIATAAEICRRFPERATRPRMIAVTAHAEPEDRARCLAAGMDALLGKPLSPRPLEACLERIYGQAPRAAVSSAPRQATLARSALPRLDRAHLAALTADLTPLFAATLLDEMFVAWRVDYQAVQPRLAAACAAREAVPLTDFVHGLKGGAAGLGWQAMAGCCGAALQELRAGHFADWEELPGALDRHYAAAAAEMTLLIGALDRGDDAWLRD